MNEPDPPAVPDVSALARMPGGGLGQVFRGRSVTTGRGVVVKVLPGPFDRRSKAQFDSERQRLASLRQLPSVLPVDQVDTLPDGRPYLISELCTDSLAEAITRGDRLSAARAVALGAELVEALARAHEVDVVHGAVSPYNVLFRRTGQVTLSDFGLALRQSYPADPGDTGEYAAPETLRDGGLSVRSDLYGLGATLYAALTGTPPFPARIGEHPSERILRVISQTAPQLQPDAAPAPLAALIAELLAVDPADRPGDATMVAERFVQLRETIVDRPGPAGAGGPVGSPSAPPAGTSGAPPAGAATAPPPTGGPSAPPAGTLITPGPSPGPTGAPAPVGSLPTAPGPLAAPGGPGVPPGSAPPPPGAPTPPIVPAGSPTSATPPPGGPVGPPAAPPGGGGRSDASTDWSGLLDDVLFDAEPVDETDRPGAAAAPATGLAHRSGRRVGLWSAAAVGGVAILVGVSALATRLISGNPDPAPNATVPVRSSPVAQQPAGRGAVPAVRLVSTDDRGSSVKLTWRGSAKLSYAVIVAEPGQPTQVVLAHHARTFRVQVTPGRQYCFAIQATNGEHVVETDPRGIRGAVCKT